MRNIFFIFFIALLTQVSAQYKGIGGELLSKDAYQYGRYQVKLTPSDDSAYTSSFFLHSKIKNQTQTIKFDINAQQSVCYISSQNIYIAKIFDVRNKEAQYNIEWTPNRIKCSINEEIIIDTAFDTALLNKPSRIGLSIWRENKKTNSITEVDTTLAEARNFQYYEYINDNPDSFKLKHSDNFNEFNMVFWTKSTERYPENMLQNDSTMLFFDNSKLQIISLSYKTRTGIFKRASHKEYPKRINVSRYELLGNTPSLILTFSDTIYSLDRSVNNFVLENHQIIKSKLKADYKTVVLTLEKALDHRTSLKYYPINSRFRKPQTIEIIKGE